MAQSNFTNVNISSDNLHTVHDDKPSGLNILLDTIFAGKQTWKTVKYSNDTVREIKESLSNEKILNNTDEPFRTV